MKQVEEDWIEIDPPCVMRAPRIPIIPDAETTIYFIQGTLTGLIKIGRTGDIIRRFDIMQSNSPDELNVLFLLRGPFELETEIHKRLDDSRVRREWFMPTPQLVDAMTRFGWEEGLVYL